MRNYSDASVPVSGGQIANCIHMIIFITCVQMHVTPPKVSQMV